MSDGAALPPPTGAPTPGVKPPQSARRRAAVPIAIGTVIAGGLVVGALALSGGDDETADERPNISITLNLPTASTVEVVSTTAPPATLPATTTAAPPPTTAEPTTPNTTQPPTTTATTTTTALPVATTTTTPTTTTTSVPPATTTTTTAPPAPPPTTTLPQVTTTLAPVVHPVAPDGRAVIIMATREPCKFGANCLVAGFAVWGFSYQPEHYTCEFSSGKRNTYRFIDSTIIEYACATGVSDDTITIEVDGIRSATVSGPTNGN